MFRPLERPSPPLCGLQNTDLEGGGGGGVIGGGGRESVLIVWEVGGRERGIQCCLNKNLERMLEKTRRQWKQEIAGDNPQKRKQF